MGKLFLLTSFLVITPFIFFICIVYYAYLSYQKNPTANSLSLSSTYTNKVAFAALPTSQNILEGKIEQEDARIEMIRQFFAKYKSPLEPYAAHIVENADKYGLDFRLLPAIAMQESNLCNKAPENSYNCWGFGIYGTTVTRFSGFEEAIDTVTRTLVTKYKNQGLESPEEIMKKYTPSSNGSWANGVNYFLNVLR